MAKEVGCNDTSKTAYALRFATLTLQGAGIPSFALAGSHRPQHPSLGQPP
ncbi:hypothetical protein TIFTF001_011918 [Ficus carica]|uniref:Uncharacterized protein n=1 Tax=Ficus carica TaxID=3494 RepID=A0AA88D179_FICCA|nr:hypothetical protein TIFTF001_011918 [Ficus carica]